VSELAAELDTYRAAVYRLLGPLTDHHLVRREDDGRILLAPGLITLAAAVTPLVYEVAEQVLQDLADELSATVALTIRDGDDAVVARVVVPRTAEVHLTYKVGMRHPLIRGAPGHALLAAAPPAPDEPAFVSIARKHGYAVSEGQLLPGATGVGVAISRPSHEPDVAISAVWIEGHDPTVAAQSVLTAAAEIARRLA
jgi:DNA-binding IclR family transcriptional regulator